jgi:hypothetical protein
MPVRFPPGARQTDNETKLDRVFGDREHDWNRHCCTFGRQRRSKACGRGNDRDLPAHQIGRQLRQAIDLLGPAVVDRHVLALDIARLFEALAKGTQAPGNRLGRSDFEKSDHRHDRLLPARRERPRGCRAAEQRDKRAPPHSITSSARASSVGGMSRPSALAVLRLMTSSTFVDCWTGKSAGFAP